MSKQPMVFVTSKNYNQFTDSRTGVVFAETPRNVDGKALFVGVASVPLDVAKKYYNNTENYTIEGIEEAETALAKELPTEQTVEVVTVPVGVETVKPEETTTAKPAPQTIEVQTTEDGQVPSTAKSDAPVTTTTTVASKPIPTTTAAKTAAK